jgi:hypothetical protein
MEDHAAAHRLRLPDAGGEDEDDGFLKMAREIALSHHEKWDGNYNGPAGRSGPPAGRIAAVADVFDALGCKRPYEAYPLESPSLRGRANHFDRWWPPSSICKGYLHPAAIES